MVSKGGVTTIDISRLGLASSEDLQLASVEIKTSISASSLDRTLQSASEDVFSVTVGYEKFVNKMPHDLGGQILQQALVLAVNHIVYVSASVTNILFICKIAVPPPICEAAFSMLYSKLHAVVDWAHQSDPKVSQSEESSSRRILSEKIQLWKLVNDHISEHGPFPHLKLFKHGSQSFYSKTEGGIDGAAQNRPTLKSSMVALRWEEKLVTQTIKSVVANAFLLWRMSQRANVLAHKEQF